MRGEAETLAPAHRGGSESYPGEELPLLIDALRLLYHSLLENAKEKRRIFYNNAVVINITVIFYTNLRILTEKVT